MFLENFQWIPVQSSFVEQWYMQWVKQKKTLAMSASWTGPTFQVMSLPWFLRIHCDFQSLKDEATEEQLSVLKNGKNIF